MFFYLSLIPLIIKCFLSGFKTLKPIFLHLILYSSFNLLVFVKYLQLLRICTIERFIEDGWFGVQLVVLLVLMSLVRE